MGDIDQGDLTVEVGGEGFVEGFSEGMEGHKLNETFDISLTLPENYPAEIAGERCSVYRNDQFHYRGDPARAER